MLHQRSSWQSSVHSVQQMLGYSYYNLCSYDLVSKRSRVLDDNTTVCYECHFVMFVETFLMFIFCWWISNDIQSIVGIKDPFLPLQISLESAFVGLTAAKKWIWGSLLQQQRGSGDGCAAGGGWNYLRHTRCKAQVSSLEKVQSPGAAWSSEELKDLFPTLLIEWMAEVGTSI